MIFEINPESRVTFIDQVNDKKWPQWKKYKDCNEEEKKKINLGMPTKNYLVLDKDLANKTDKEIIAEYHSFKELLKQMDIENFIADRSPHGFHIFAKFDQLNDLDDDVAKEVRRIYVKKLGCDEAKISTRGVISLPQKPHFKTGKTYNLLDEFYGNNQLKLAYIEGAKNQVKKNKEMLSKINFDKDYVNYFENDPFFQYIKNNEIPDNTNRDMTIFPNLAIAAVKSGKTDVQIKEIISPIITDNFPGKTYSEFEGWLRKVRNKEITDYNPFQLNTWMRTYAINRREVYDLKPIEVETLEREKVINGEKFKFIWDEDLHKLKDIKIEWLVDKWIPKGDICFIAGKAASFKSTIVVHVGYAISEGKLVFNKYETIQSKVLYLNEENARPIMLSMINRVKKGLDLQESKTKNVCFSILENIKLDSIDDLNYLINFINKNKFKLLICDSFRRFINFDENNATEMNRFFNNLKAIRSRCQNITIIILHHLKKENTQYAQDMKDMLRGSSDIVNSADSIIGIKRKRGCNAVQIEHIKNRSGEEVTNKLVLMNTGENKDMAYFYESDKEMDKEKILSKIDNCADDIVKFLKEKKMKIFARKDFIPLEKDHSIDTIAKALRALKMDGTIIDDGSKGGKYKKYTLSSF